MSAQAEPAIYNLTEPVVMAYPNLHTARAFGKKGKESGEPKYSANFIFKPDSTDLAELKKLAVKVARERWPDRELKELKFPFSSGDKLNERRVKQGKKAEDYAAGMVVVAARSKYEPRLSGIENGKMVDYEGDARIAAKPKFYPGVLVLAQFNFVAYDGVGANPDGVTAYLNMVFSTGKGKKLAGGSSAAETFKGYAGTSTTEDPTGGNDFDDPLSF